MITFKKNEQIDFIKIDIQGFDYFALLGMKKTIERSKKVILYGEFWPYGLKKSGITPLEYLNLLEKMGFTIEWESPFKKEDALDKSNDLLFDMNFIAIKE